MTEAKHTPGPMIVLYGAGTCELHLAPNNYATTAKTRILRLDRTPENITFLKTLAAAPDMLAALQAQETAEELAQDRSGALGGYQRWQEAEDRAASLRRAAIAKATGAA